MTINIEARKQRKYDGITEAASAATVRLLLLNSTPLLTSTLPFGILMPGTTANMSERKQKKMGYVNGETNGETNGHKEGYVIPRSIPQEPVTVNRQPWIPPKDSKLEHPGTTPIAPSLSAV
jgi:hypothetical protein